MYLQGQQNFSYLECVLMIDIMFENDGEQHQIALQEGESVLEGIVRSGHDVPNSCRAGVCQSCKMMTDDAVPPIAQKGLKSTHKEQGYFLSCCCHPSESMRIKLAPAAQQFQTIVLSKKIVSDEVLILHISKEFDYRPGQFISLQSSDGESRCYSIASHNKLHEYIELHVRIYEQGQVSSWLAKDLQVGDDLTVVGATGECFYVAEDQQKPLFLCGIGTGFAPLYGILKDALYQGHQGPIHMLLGAKTDDGFYYNEWLSCLRSSQVSIHQVALSINDARNKHSFKADIYRYAQKFVPDFANAQVYLCGAETFVQKMRKVCFLAGTPMQSIAADAFVQSR